MLDLLALFKAKRWIIRQRLLRHFDELDNCLFGLAALIFFAYLPTITAPPVAAATAPPEAVAVGALILVGAAFCATIVGAPIGLIIL